MTDTAVLVETTLRDTAIAAADEFVRGHGHAVKRAQIKGLRQIAENEPAKVRDFAGHQREKAQERAAKARGERQAEHAAAVDFWRLVGDLCTANGKGDWSLLVERKGCVPEALRPEKQASGARLSKEEQDALKKKKDDLQAWERAWDARCYPPFFQAFCAHYLHKMPDE
jgi:hypothetical protein